MKIQQRRRCSDAYKTIYYNCADAEDKISLCVSKVCDLSALYVSTHHSWWEQGAPTFNQRNGNGKKLKIH